LASHRSGNGAVSRTLARRCDHDEGERPAGMRGGFAQEAAVASTGAGCAQCECQVRSWWQQTHTRHPRTSARRHAVSCWLTLQRTAAFESALVARASGRAHACMRRAPAGAEQLCSIRRASRRGPLETGAQRSPRRSSASCLSVSCAQRSRAAQLSMSPTRRPTAISKPLFASSVSCRPHGPPAPQLGTHRAAVPSNGSALESL